MRHTSMTATTTDDEQHTSRGALIDTGGADQDQILGEITRVVGNAGEV